MSRCRASGRRPRVASPIGISVSRHPSSRRIRLALALPAGAGPLRSAALLDWRGRRIADWTGSLPGAGSDRVELEWAGDAFPGVYILRTEAGKGPGAGSFFLGE